MLGTATQLQLAPLGAGDLIDRAVRLYRRHLIVLIRTAAPPVIVTAIGWILVGIYVPKLAATPDTAELVEFVLLMLLGVVIMYVGYLFMMIVMGGATRTLVAHLLRNDPVTARATYNAVRSRFWGLLLASFLISVWMGASWFGAALGAYAVFVVFMIPISVAGLMGSVVLSGIIGIVAMLAAMAVSVLLFFFLVGRVAYVPQVMLVEGKGVFSAFGRSLS